MSHLITCPECDKHLQVPEDLIGRKVQCPECKQTFTAELADEQAPSKSGKSKRTDDSDEVEKRSTKAGVPKKTNRRDDDDDDDDDDDRARRRRDDDDDDDDDDLDVRRSGRSSRRGSGAEKPGHVTGMGVMALVGGIWAILLSLGLVGATCCVWVPSVYGFVVGIMAIIKGASLLGSNAYLNRPPTGIGVMLIINIINGDVLGLVLGILILVFSGDEEVKGYLAK